MRRINGLSTSPEGGLQHSNPVLPRLPEASYIYNMNTARMDQILSLLKPDEVHDALWLIDVFERWPCPLPKPTSGGGGLWETRGLIILFLFQLLGS